MARDRGKPADPTRSLALLWRTREPASRDGRADLSVDKIVRVATGVADTEGVAALTMRRVSEALGVGTMSTYTYVQGKPELLDLMVDTAYGELAALDPSGTWRDRLDRVAMANWALYLAHPWLAHVETSRPVLGPNAIAKYERELTALAGTGLDDVELDSVLALVLGHVRTAARASVEAEDLRRDTGLTDEQWWRIQAPWLARHTTADEHPTASRVGTAAGTEHRAASSPEHILRFGLDRLLDGIAVLVDGR
ncbi:TetR/AcrR family transcriptional regulator C-terminal domain-containing protein [Actinokineospora cianjurensis]|uniref:TetR family transcriptional regulator n=1 Tax=Actinokineospora cianjurensis TaxID=585224 RepID=A0A421B3M4_9PSEU|nr:TetR/AcrR family transcriptional regulator C-terminal domain-containing protein [Actinokineospora cianjurensis]RLK58964.1 TetR family transcriptional regulator [Actinokineospora cianjurensis]